MSSTADRPAVVNNNTMLSMHTYWKNTISVCEAAMSMLATFENQDHRLVEDAVKSLRQLLRHGRSFESMKQYVPPPPTTTTTTTVVAGTGQQQQQQQRSRARKTIQELDFNPRENWTLVDNKTVHVRLPNNTHITCKVITTVEELDIILPALRNASRIAIDCEFLGLKGYTPELKVLQLAVSSSLGYALAIDLIGHEAARERLVPILSCQHKAGGSKNEGRRYIAWAFRADAEAIEWAFPGIELPFVLDLQAKLKRVAVEHLSLFNGMNRYAKDWPGLDEFNKAKQLGDTFKYSGPNCVWMQHPLPPECFVYAVFDVVSLIALHDAIEQYPTATEHFWPETVISTSSPKALERWQRNRSMAAASAMQNQQQQRAAAATTDAGSTITLVETDTVTIRKDKQRMRLDASVATSSTRTTIATAPASTSATASAPAPAPAAGGRGAEFDDENPQFIADMEEALRRSREEAQIHHTNQPSGSRQASWESQSVEKDRTLEELADADADGEAHFAEDIYDESHNRRDGANPIKLGTWDSAETTSLEWGGNGSGSVSGSNTGNEQQQAPATTNDAQPTYEHMQRINNAMNQHASGEFAFSAPPEQESWDALAEASVSDWRRNVDVELDWSEMEKKNTERSRKESAQPAETVKFHTSMHGHHLASWASGKNSKGTSRASDGWTKKDARPTMMKMRVNHVPKLKTKSKKRGPRVSMPTDFDDDDDDDDDDDYSVSSIEPSDSDSSEVANTEEDTYKDDIFLYHDQPAIHVHLLREVGQLAALPKLSEIDDQQRPLTAAIAVQAHRIVMRNGDSELNVKALQIYLSTGDAYTLLTDRVYGMPDKIKNSIIGYVLTSPDVRRVMWGFQFVANQLQERLGFTPGSMIDLATCFNDHLNENADPVSVWDAAVSVAGDHQRENLDLYQALKNDVDALLNRKFSGSIWDKERVPEALVNYSAMQAWLLYTIYKGTVERQYPLIKDYHVWKHNSNYSIEL